MSFLSVEPQPRVLLENYSNILLAQFNTQKEIISDRYLAFFQERRSIEATYIDSLRKLHRNAQIVDASFDPRAESTTTRAAWDKVRDNLEREASTQQGFVDILDSEVIRPLTVLKKSHNLTRDQFEKNLKGSTAMYADYAENQISTLQREYLNIFHPRFGGNGSAPSRGCQEPANSEGGIAVSDDDCRVAVGILNSFRSIRAECLGDGYDRLEEFASMPIFKNIIVKYMDGMVMARAKFDELALSTRAEVEKALAGTDTPDLKASFRRALSSSIPPLTLYHNYRLGAYSDSDLIFGVPLTELTTNQDNVPNVMRMCIEEVEKRGLNTKKIYSRGLPGLVYDDAEVLQLRRRFESEKSFSFSSTDNIHCVAKLLMLYLWDLPEPLAAFMLSFQDYRYYGQNRSRYAENDCSLLRSKIHELHPVHRASLGALLGHLLRVSSHSDENEMTVEALAAQFWCPVLRGFVVVSYDGSGAKLRSKELVMEDLIQNAYTLFDERLSPSPIVPSPDVAETASTLSDGPLNMGLGLPRPAEAQAIGTTTLHLPGLVGGTHTSTQSSFTSLPSDAAIASRITPSPTPLLNPQHGLPSSQTLTDRVETTTEAQAILEARGTKAVETLMDSTPAEVVSVQPTSVPQ